MIEVYGADALRIVQSCWRSVRNVEELRVNQVYYGTWIGPDDRALLLRKTSLYVVHLKIASKSSATADSWHLSEYCRDLESCGVNVADHDTGRPQISMEQ